MTCVARVRESGWMFPLFFFLRCFIYYLSFFFFKCNYKSLYIFLYDTLFIFTSFPALNPSRSVLVDAQNVSARCV